MRILERNHAQKGLTLVEVLAALVILGIVFISIMAIFPQMTLFNEKTEKKLDTMNLARQEMSKLTSQDYTNDVIHNTNNIAINKFLSILNVDAEGNPIVAYAISVVPDPENKHPEYIEYKVVNSPSDFIYFLQVYQIADLTGTVSLFKIILQVKNEKDETPSSETYGYLEVS